MSGGVDSAVAAHLVAADGRRGRGHARAVGRPRERRRAQLLLGVGGRAGARARPLDGAPALHDRPARRVPRRGRGAVHRRLRRRRDAEPVRRLQRPRAARRDARARRPARRARRWRPATTRGSPSPTTSAGRCCASPPTRPRTRPTCWRRCDPASLARMAFPLGELRQARGPADRRRGRPAGRRQGRLAGSVLPRRHRPRALPRPPRRPRRPPGDARRRRRHRPRPPPRPAPVHGRPAARARRQPRRAAVRARQGRRAPARHGRAAGGAADPRVAVRAARLHRPGARVDRVKLRYRSRPLRADGRRRARRRAAPRRWRWS